MGALDPWWEQYPAAAVCPGLVWQLAEAGEVRGSCRGRQRKGELCEPVQEGEEKSGAREGSRLTRKLQ